MPKFLHGSSLNVALEQLFEDAKDQLILISPYIKLHDRLASILKSKAESHKLQITLVFGKNENNMAKSLKAEDFTFFKQLPNIEIRYEKRLHAKFYANEFSCILTSLNLYSYSQDNNIEAGVMFDASLVSSLNSMIGGSDSLDVQSLKFFKRVIEQSDLLFQKIPAYDSSMFGLSKTYTGSKIEVDQLTEFFHGESTDKFERKRFTKDNLDAESILKKTNIKSNGFCIRSGVQIPFNTSLPFSDSAFQIWKKHSNKTYPEKFCHFSGQPSHGETSFSRPIKMEFYSKAKALHNL